KRTEVSQQLHPEADPGCRLDVDRFTVQQVRPILPLLHRFKSSLRQNWVATDDCKVSDPSFLIDGESKNHIAYQVLLFGFNWVFWPYCFDNAVPCNIGRDP